ncbi:MAG: replication-relaxation family protein, partial [Actinobacteria bacterium]|nr:replication-relaxation family protein [Actinomycetota bacterium]
MRVGWRLVRRWLLALLGEHKVLTTNQIAAVAFTSVRRAQDRLLQLRRLGVVFAFRDSYTGGGTSQTRYALGYLGARLIAAQRAQNPPRPQAHQQRLERLGVWPKLSHHLGVNGFFCDLAAYARRDPRTVRGADGVSGLTMWWSEQRCAEFFWNTTTKLHPDGYGCWEQRGRTVRFFLEHDTGTESLTTVTRKLADYDAYPTDTFGILLFSVHSTQRETTLRAALRRVVGRDRAVVIATAARDHGHADGPAGPIWGLWSPRDGDTVTHRYRLAELPQRGPRVVHHEPWPGQPFSEAAFDPLDQTILRHVNTPPPQPVVPEPAQPSTY